MMDRSLAGASRSTLDAGRLFVVEGIDGSGKSTQIARLAQWLLAEAIRWWR